MAFILPKVTATFNVLNYSMLYLKSPTELILVYNNLGHIQCWWSDPCPGQPTWLQLVGPLALNNAYIIEYFPYHLKSTQSDDSYHPPQHTEDNILKILQQPP